MRRRNHRTKAAETLKKKTDSRFGGFDFSDPSSSGEHSDLKRRRRVTFVDVDHRSPFNDSHEAQKAVDAKTSEFAFFKKLKSDFGLCSQSSDSKSSNKVKQNPRTFEFTVESEDKEFAGTDREARDRCNGYSFSTPMLTTRRGSCGLFMSPVNLVRKDKEKDLAKSSSAVRRDKDTIQSGDNLRSGGISDEKGDLFTVKRKKLHQWVKDIWFPESHPELNSNRHDLVSILLSRLFPGTEDTYPHPSRFSTEMTDGVKRKTFLDSPGSKFLKRSNANNSEYDHRLQMRKDRSISWKGWPENSITPSLQFPTGHDYSSFITRDPEESSFRISYPYGPVYRPPFLKQKASLSFPVEETLEYSPISSVHFRSYKPLSLGYHRQDSGYSSEDLSHDLREPSSALLLEWNTESARTRKTDDLPPSYPTKLITYTNASSSSLTDTPWTLNCSSSHDLVTRELCPLPLLSRHTSDSFFLPTASQPSHFENEFERHIIDGEDVAAANQNLQTFRHTNISDCLTRDCTYDHNRSNPPLDHCPFQVPGYELASFPFSSISNSDLLEASRPTQSDRFKCHDWIPLKFQSPQTWIDS